VLGGISNSFQKGLSIHFDLLFRRLVFLDHLVTEISSRVIKKEARFSGACLVPNKLHTLTQPTSVAFSKRAVHTFDLLFRRLISGQQFGFLYSLH
jgi:hypothetical protein